MVLLLQNLPVAVTVIRGTFCNELKHSRYDDENSQE